MHNLRMCLTVVVGAVCGPVLAHHSDAMFEREKVLELNGTVKEFQFTNPHTWVQLDVKDSAGKTVEWSLEWGSPNQLGRQGIRPSTFPAGATVTIRTNPMKDGSAGGAFIGAKLADGTIIGSWE
jgi:Family of unknown function (DUF6152)